LVRPSRRIPLKKGLFHGFNILVQYNSNKVIRSKQIVKELKNEYGRLIKLKISPDFKISINRRNKNFDEMNRQIPQAPRKHIQLLKGIIEERKKLMKYYEETTSEYEKYLKEVEVYQDAQKRMSFLAKKSKEEHIKATKFSATAQKFKDMRDLVSS
jgi:t-SNARE complex subunit (syntaxin)